MQRYNPKDIEPKWQKKWSEDKLYEVHEDKNHPKKYVTAMFPYPSGAGLHVGHVRNYSITDAIARYHRQNGNNVLSTIGWDGFGLPAENYAIKTGTPPAVSTAQNIANFKSQLERLGMSYDWSRELNTTDPSYYKWTQWIFTQLFAQGLAYQKESLQWWCPFDKTVLANEQVEGGKCWRCGNEVIKKSMKQWFFRITDYADELLDAIPELDWPEKIKTMQTNWIGRSKGAEISWQVCDNDGNVEDLSFETFTTRKDTIPGVTFIVVAPESPLLDALTAEDHRARVHSYRADAVRLTDVQRQEDKTKTGVFTGKYAKNPFTSHVIPIYVANYVLGGYGTGVVMGMGGHDLRDREFAIKHDLPNILTTEVSKEYEDLMSLEVYSGKGKQINTGEGYDGLSNKEAGDKIFAELAAKGLAKEQTNYKMRDWLISRQRYWGAPIPIIHCEKDGAVAVPDKDLPVILPEVANYEPDGSGHSALAKATDWVNTTCPACGGPALRETDTMDGYVDSSWYIFRYADAHNETAVWDPAKVNYWAPLDFYCGGDHAVAHLLYVRFWTHVFKQMGLTNFTEPIKRLVYNGYIYASDGTKMSKSKGNVVDPLEVVDSGYGADALRTYELFCGPYEQDTTWDPGGVAGTHRFLNRLWTLVQEYLESNSETSDAQGEAIYAATHRAIKKVTNDLDQLNFNTAIAAMMEGVNDLYKIKAEDKYAAKGAWQFALTSLTQLIAPFAPHIAEELWQQLGHNGSVHTAPWPKHDEKYLVTDVITIAVQVNGKLRGTIEVATDADEATTVAAAKIDAKVAAHLNGQTIKKTIYVPGKLVNFVV